MFCVSDEAGAMNRLRAMAGFAAMRWTPIYKALDWKWGDPAHVPDEQEVLDTILRLIDLFEGAGSALEGSHCRSGGIEVGRDFDGWYIAFVDDCNVYSEDPEGDDE